jgi:hypothetical protein
VKFAAVLLAVVAVIAAVVGALALDDDDAETSSDGDGSTTALGSASSGPGLVPSSASTGSVDGGVDVPPSVPDDIVARANEQLARALARVQAERIDPDWGPAAATRLEQDLAAATEGRPSRVVRVECRSESCVATLAWPDYATAFSTYRGLLIQPYSLNCQRSMSVPPPADPSVAYEAQLIFSCDRSEPRSG